MRYRKFGNSGLKTSVIGFGGWPGVKVIMAPLTKMKWFMPFTSLLI